MGSVHSFSEWDASNQYTLHLRYWIRKRTTRAYVLYPSFTLSLSLLLSFVHSSRGVISAEYICWWQNYWRRMAKRSVATERMYIKGTKFLKMYSTIEPNSAIKLYRRMTGPYHRLGAHTIRFSANLDQICEVSNNWMEMDTHSVGGWLAGWLALLDATHRTPHIHSRWSNRWPASAYIAYNETISKFNWKKMIL